MKSPLGISLKILLFSFTAIFPGTIFGQNNDSVKTLMPEVSYTGDVIHNSSGGIKTGTTYLGIVNLRFTVNLWKGSRIFFNGANTHGAEPSLTHIGDHQVVSNIEAGDHTYVQELWFSQSWKRFEVTIGLQDLNVDYANLSQGLFYLNSSFGILPTVSTNVPAPIFPLTSLGISGKWHINTTTSFMIAAFDGEPTNFEDNPHNISWNLTKNDGFLFFGEMQRKMASGLPGSIKAGIYLHRHFFDDEYDLIDSNSLHRNNYGFYLLGEKELWHQQNGNKAVAAFIQTGLSPKRISTNIFYLGMGINFYGLLNRRGEDIAGIAIAHDILRGSKGNETTIEASYQVPIFGRFFIQPDIQYIINPSGTDLKLNNSLVFAFRFGITLP